MPGPIPAYPLSAAGAAAPRLELVGGVTKVWDHDKYNSFTDLIWFGGGWYCTFREGDAHVGGDGRLRALVLGRAGFERLQA
jgi:hypothetical protein